MKHILKLAQREAESAAQEGEVPVGAVVFRADTMEVVASAHNRTRQDCDPSGHAEILALRAAGRTLGAARLPDLAIYATLEPCPMCAAAIGHARLKRLYFGACDPKGGGVENGARVFATTPALPAPEIYGGLGEAEAERLLADFFATLRKDGA